MTNFKIYYHEDGFNVEEEVEIEITYNITMVRGGDKYTLLLSEQSFEDFNPDIDEDGEFMDTTPNYEFLSRMTDYEFGPVMDDDE